MGRFLGLAACGFILAVGGGCAKFECEVAGEGVYELDSASGSLDSDFTANDVELTTTVSKNTCNGTTGSTTTSGFSMSRSGDTITVDQPYPYDDYDMSVSGTSVSAPGESATSGDCTATSSGVSGTIDDSAKEISVLETVAYEGDDCEALLGLE